MEAFLWCLSVLMCILGTLGGIWGCLQGGVWGDGIVLNYVLGALGPLGDVLKVFWGCWGRFNWCWGF